MTIDVVTLNLRNPDDPDGNSRKERLFRIKKVLCPYNADIINYQEFSKGWELLESELLGSEYDCYKQFRSENGEAALISWKKTRFDCVKKGSFWLSETPNVMSKSKDWDDKWDCYRICSYVVLKEKTTNKEFTVMNTHYGFGDYGQVNSSKLICKYRKLISDNPTFVTGDFNMNPDALAYAELTKTLIDVNMATKRDTRNTFHGYGKSNKLARLDYCFIDDKITAIDSKVIDTLVDGKYLSDHYPVLYKLKIN